MDVKFMFDYVLTRHGRLAAYLGPQNRKTQTLAKQAVTELLAWRKSVTGRNSVLQPGETIKSLIAKGRP